MDNTYLNAAKQAKKDEFYTQLCDIEAELKYYTDHFKGKAVYCNCDDPYESNFFKYFVVHFNELKLKKLICTCYDGNPVNHDTKRLFDYHMISKSERKAYKIEVTSVDSCVTSEMSNSELISNLDGKPTLLKCDGDFRSRECVELLKETDIVVTNPPFSLFREYIALLVKYEKKFLIIGNVNVVTYKEVFPLFKENKLWLGTIIHSCAKEFRVSDSYPLQSAGWRIDENGIKYIRVNGIRWFTNLDYSERHEDLVLHHSYTPQEYPQYANYDAVDVNKIAYIPCDFHGIMGVPPTFMDKFNPEQFEIIGCADYTGKYGSDDIGVSRIGEEWVAKYREQGGKGHYTANMTRLVYYDTNGKACNTFKRILIRRKK